MNDEQQIQFDRMVDGELNVDEQRVVLQDCERDETWRELALTYVESQTWRSELSELIPRPAGKDELVVEGRNRDSGGAAWNPLALAAAMLVALGAGYGLGWSWQSPTAAMPDTTITQNTAPKAAEDPQLASIPLMVEDRESGSLRQVEWPIIKASELDPRWLDREGVQLPEELRARLRDNGVGVSRTRIFAPFQDAEGRRILVPIEYYIERDYQ